SHRSVHVSDAGGTAAGRLARVGTALPALGDLPRGTAPPDQSRSRRDDREDRAPLPRQTASGTHRIAERRVDEGSAESRRRHRAQPGRDNADQMPASNHTTTLSFLVPFHSLFWRPVGRRNLQEAGARLYGTAGDATVAPGFANEAD